MKAKNPIRVAQVVGPAVLGGVDTMVMNYYRHIDRSKVQFDFIMDGYNETLIDDEIKALGGRVYKVEPYAQNMLKSMRQYYRIFKDNHYLIVHSHMNTLSVFPLFEAWRAGVPVRIAHSHSTAGKGEGKRTAMKYMLRPFAKVFPTHYCACSEYAGRWLFGDRTFHCGKVHLVKNAIDLDRFRFKPEVREQVRTQLGINDKFVVGHVGRFMYQKNHEFLVDVFSEIHKKNPDSVLLLVGNGPLQERIQRKVNNLGLSEAVKFLGLRKDVPELMQAMDTLLLPSHYEGLGMVAVEAQASGLWTVCSEAIPEDARISKHMVYCHLDQSAEAWAKIVLCRKERRSSAYLNEKGKDYEITTASNKLTDFYFDSMTGKIN